MKKLIPILIPILLIVGYFGGKKLYHVPDYGGGQVAPNFQGTKPNGETFKLKDLQGQYVLLEFWGSWCGTCRAAHPGLIKIHDKFHGKQYKDASGFEIVSVGMETKEDRWKRAIEKDDLKWEYHTAEFGKKYFDTALATDYGITWAPTSFLIDTKGNIMKVNPSKSFLDEFLSKKMK
jgi:thiol-disulfide isomerase/thioredoxin